MIKIKQLLLAWGLAFLGIIQLTGQGFTFDSGSDGSYGAINVTENTTIPLPPDGILHATTVDIAEGFQLNFTRNEFNTPVYILATGDVTIHGKINVNGGIGNGVVGGVGGPGGFDGGNPGSLGVPPGDGFGPGGGKAGEWNQNADGAGAGGYATKAVNGSSAGKGDTYGSPLLIPLIGGSGAGGADGVPGHGGSGGGGAILIASNTQIEFSTNARIHANGGRIVHSAVLNGGSGGAIRFVAPKVFGAGQLQAESTWTGWQLNDDRYGGYGRIRIDTIDRSGLAFDFQPIELTSVGANMVVFPEPLPRLDISEVAGTAVTLDTTNSVFVDLPFNADPNRTVTVRAEDFDKVVNISVVLQPISGDRIIYEDTIDNTTTNPATKVVNVVFPVNTQTKVFVWTRPDA